MPGMEDGEAFAWAAIGRYPIADLPPGTVRQFNLGWMIPEDLGNRTATAQNP